MQLNILVLQIGIRSFILNFKARKVTLFIGCIWIDTCHAGLDWGGVSREFFELVSVRCFDPLYSLYMRFSDNPQALVSQCRQNANALYSIITTMSKP